MDIKIRHFSMVVLCIVHSTENTVANNLYSGLLSPVCVQHYYEVFVKKSEPAIHYKYFHELSGLHKLNRFRIESESKVTIEEVPYQVQYGKNCGGVLISPRWVLTTARCSGNDTYVLVGSSKRDKGRRHNICAHFIHPLWSNKNGKKNQTHLREWDFQLLMLEYPVRITNTSRPIAIGKEEDIVPGELMTVSRWGSKESETGAVLPVVNMRRLFVPIIEPQQCEAIYPRHNFETSFCGGLPYAVNVSYQGGQGGAAVTRRKLVGLLSSAPCDVSSEKPTVYCNVPAVLSWIREITLLSH